MYGASFFMVIDLEGVSNSYLQPNGAPGPGSGPIHLAIRCWMEYKSFCNEFPCPLPCQSVYYSMHPDSASPASVVRKKTVFLNVSS